MTWIVNKAMPMHNIDEKCHIRKVRIKTRLLVIIKDSFLRMDKHACQLPRQKQFRLTTKYNKSHNLWVHLCISLCLISVHC